MNNSSINYYHAISHRALSGTIPLPGRCIALGLDTSTHAVKQGFSNSGEYQTTGGIAGGHVEADPLALEVRRSNTADFVCYLTTFVEERDT